ncbi:MAG: hypothetical protein ABIE22_04595 [archaeon]
MGQRVYSDAKIEDLLREGADGQNVCLKGYLSDINPISEKDARFNLSVGENSIEGFMPGKIHPLIKTTLDFMSGGGVIVRGVYVKGENSVGKVRVQEISTDDSGLY